jgi:hypothetical protein
MGLARKFGITGIGLAAILSFSGCAEMDQLGNDIIAAGGRKLLGSPPQDQKTVVYRESAAPVDPTPTLEISRMVNDANNNGFYDQGDTCEGTRVLRMHDLMIATVSNPGSSDVYIKFNIRREGLIVEQSDYARVPSFNSVQMNWTLRVRDLPGSGEYWVELYNDENQVVRRKVFNVSDY